jgi:hypothetical protein
MDFDRRGFLKVAGLTLLGLSVKPGWQVFSKEEPAEPSPDADLFPQMLERGRMQGLHRCLSPHP